MSWQPIGTAPMDGTEVITAKKSDTVRAFDHFPYPLKSKFMDGSWKAEFSDGEWHKYDPQPTHWLPISPPLPISQAIRQHSQKGRDND